MTGGPGLQVLVVDDQELVREGIASLLGLQPGIGSVRTATDGEGAVGVALQARPDVVLMDIQMPGMGGVAAIVALREAGVECPVVMLTTFDDDELVAAALGAGASGYLLKDLPAADLGAGVVAASRGIAPFDPEVARRLARAGGRGIAPSLGLPAGGASVAGSSDGRASAEGEVGVGEVALRLTARETEVVRLVAAGRTNREIAAELYLGQGTVKNHLARVLARSGLRDRTQLAVRARELGLI